MIKSEGLLVKFKKVYAEQLSCINTDGKSSTSNNGTAPEKQKEKDTNQDYVKENSKIYGRGTQKQLTNWQNAVNEAAYQIVQSNSSLLFDRANLKFQVEAKARETYIFKKRSGSRSRLTQSDSENQVKRTKLNSSQRVSLLSSLSEQLDSVKSQIAITQKHIGRSTNTSDFEACSKAHVQLRKLLGEKQSLQNKLTDIESRHARSRKKCKDTSSKTMQSTISVAGIQNITNFFSQKESADKTTLLQNVSETSAKCVIEIDKAEEIHQSEICVVNDKDQENSLNDEKKPEDAKVIEKDEIMKSTAENESWVAWRMEKVLTRKKVHIKKKNPKMLKYLSQMKE